MIGTASLEQMGEAKYEIELVVSGTGTRVSAVQVSVNPIMLLWGGGGSDRESEEGEKKKNTHGGQVSTVFFGGGGGGVYQIFPPLAIHVWLRRKGLSVMTGVPELPFRLVSFMFRFTGALGE